MFVSSSVNFVVAFEIPLTWNIPKSRLAVSLSKFLLVDDRAHNQITTAHSEHRFLTYINVISIAFPIYLPAHLKFARPWKPHTSLESGYVFWRSGVHFYTDSHVNSTAAQILLSKDRQLISTPLITYHLWHHELRLYSKLGIDTGHGYLTPIVRVVGKLYLVGNSIHQAHYMHEGNLYRQPPLSNSRYQCASKNNHIYIFVGFLFVFKNPFKSCLKFIVLHTWWLQLF